MKHLYLKSKTFLLLLFLYTASISAQEYFPENKDIAVPKTKTTIFTGATIFISPTEKIEKETLWVEDDKIVAVGKNIQTPKDATTIDLKGKYVYPSFIDMYSTFGVAKPKLLVPSGGLQYDSKRNGYYWNDHIRSHVNAYESFTFDNSKASELIKLGFGVVSTHTKDGVARGTATLIALNKNASNQTRMLEKTSAQHFGFTKSSTSKQIYPSALMGTIALLRQMYYDLQWYEAHP